VAHDAPISPPKIKGSPDGALPALLFNGVIGLRVRQIPLTKGIAVVSGLSGTHPVTHVEAAAQAPYPLGADIWIGRVRLSDVLNRITQLERSYDFSCGELHSAFAFAVDDVRVSVRVRKSPTHNAAFAVMGMKLAIRTAIDTAQRFQLQYPSAWQAIEKGLRLPIEVDQVWVRGQPARLIAAHGAERATLELPVD
jgi:hypothetical protein